MLVLGHRNSVYENMRAHLPYSFRRALSEQTQIRVLSGISVDGESKLVDRTEEQSHISLLPILYDGITSTSGNNVLNGLEKLDQRRLRGISNRRYVQPRHMLYLLLPISQKLLQF